MTVKWRDIRATIEGQKQPTSIQRDYDVTLGATSGSNEERETVLDLVDDLHDIETTAPEEFTPGETNTFALENYVTTRYLDILSNEAPLAEGPTEPESARKCPSVPQDTSSAAFAIHGDEWMVW